MNDKLAKDLQKLFIDRGYNPVIGTIYQQQEYWVSWYRGDVDGFHTTQKLNAEGTAIPVYKPSLQMAKKVAEDLTSLLVNEKVELLINGDLKAQEVLDKVLEDNYFIEEAPNYVELSCVFGTGVQVEYISNGKTKINYLFGDRVVVIDYENTTPTAIAVIQQFQKDGKKYNHIMYHSYVDGIYKIQHEIYAGNKELKGLGSPVGLEAIFSEQELKKMRKTRKDGQTVIVEYYTEYETDQPHFQVFKLPISNNYDIKSPLGISLFANSIGTLENIDEKYYSSRMDSINSRKRLFIDDEASKIHKTKDQAGNFIYKKYFDSNETQYQVLKDMAQNGNKAIETFAPAYDSSQHDNAIQWELNYLSDKCMLGPNYYSYKDGVVGYQNELGLSLSNAPMRRKRNLALTRLKQVFIGMMKSIMYLEQDQDRYSGDLSKLEYDVHFDDDIFTDDASKLEKLRTDAQDGFAADWEYRMAAYGETKEEAIAMLAEINDYDENEEPIVEPFNANPPPTEEIEEDEE